MCYGENMHFLSRGSGIAILLLIAVLVVLGATGFFSRSATRSENCLAVGKGWDSGLTAIAAKSGFLCSRI